MQSNDPKPYSSSLSIIDYEKLSEPFKVVSDEDALFAYLFDKNKTVIGASVASKVFTNEQSLPLSDLEIQAKELERSAISLVESGCIDEALSKMTAAIDLLPIYASAFNNRAQIFRIKSDFSSAMSDVCEAIRLCENSAIVDESSNTRRYSRSVMNIMKQAFAQRGALYKREGRDDLAMEDLRRAALYGNAIAQLITCRQNPYATMCSEVVEQMMTKPKELP